MTQYEPPIAPHVAVMAATVGLVVAARYAPVPLALQSRKTGPAPKWLFLLALVYNTAVFLLAFMVPETGVIAPIALAPPLLLLECGTFWIVARRTGGVERWDDRCRLAWIAGLLAFFIVFGVLSGNRRGKGTHMGA